MRGGTHYSRVLFSCLAVLLYGLSSACFSGSLPPGKNVALGAHYRYSPSAGYELTKDPADATKLTDGKYAVGHFWTDRRRTIGWQRSGTIRLDIDLGREYEVYQIALNTARGDRAGVSFPQRVDLYVSPDSARYVYVGNMLLGQNIVDGSYKVEKFISSKLNTAGRYVTLFIVPKGDFTFVDEVEVFGGERDAGRLHEYPLEAKQLGSHQDNLVQIASKIASLKFIRNQLVAGWNVQGNIFAAARPELSAAIEELGNKMVAAGSNPDPGKLAVLEESLFAVHAKLLAARFNQRLLVWHGNPWSVFTPVAFPRQEEVLNKELVLDVMRGGTTSDAIGIFNSGSGLEKIQISVHPESGTGKSPHITIREARPVVLADASVKADPLVALADGGILLRGGESRQFWITVNGDTVPGTYLVRMKISIPSSGSSLMEIPLRIKVWPVEFPAHQVVKVNTWSYLNWRPIKDIPQAAIADLRSHHVNVFVLHPSQIPWPGKKDAGFRPEGKPEFSAFDRIIRLHNGTGNYLFYLEFKGDYYRGLISKEKFMGDKWSATFKEWIAAWSAHLKSLGLNYRQFAFYPCDEPQNESDMKMLSIIGRLIKEVDQSLQVYTTIDKLDRLNNNALKELSEYVDIFQVSELDLVNSRLLILKRSEKEIWCYGGGGKKADPFLKYRLMAWRAFEYGATGIGFWAYADTGSSGTAWNDSDGNRPDYAVIYEAKNSILSSKRWEAWREGVEDYELLLQAKKKLKPGKEAAEFAQRITSVLEHPDDYAHFKETRRFLLDIASR